MSCRFLYVPHPYTSDTLVNALMDQFFFNLTWKTKFLLLLWIIAQQMIWWWICCLASWIPALLYFMANFYIWDVVRPGKNWPDLNPPEDSGFWTRFSQPEPEKLVNFWVKSDPNPNPPVWPEYYILIFRFLKLLPIIREIYYIESYYRGFIQLLHHLAKLDNSMHYFSNLSHKITLYATYNGIILENEYEMA